MARGPNANRDRRVCGRGFVRSVSEPVYGVPRHRVVGSALQTEFESGTRLRRLGEIVEPVNDKAGKSVNIAREIGRRPILAVGNSDGWVRIDMSRDFRRVFPFDAP